jgi:hypothetical protein
MCWLPFETRSRPSSETALPTALTYRQLVADVATKVATASKEGGILGFGGVAVSPAEQAALDQLRSVIGER